MFHGPDQFGKILGLAGVWMVIREVSIDITEQFHHFTAHYFQQFRPQFTGNTVAAIQHDQHRPGDVHIRSNSVYIVIDVAAVSLDNAGFAAGIA